MVAMAGRGESFLFFSFFFCWLFLLLSFVPTTVIDV